MAGRPRLTGWPVAALAMLMAVPGWTQEPPRAQQFSVLVLPVSSPDAVLRPLAGPVSDALQKGLRAHGGPGQTVLVFRADDPAVQRAMREHPYLELPADGRISPALADALGWALGVDITACGVLSVEQGAAGLALRASSVKSRTVREQTARSALGEAVGAAADPAAAARWAAALVEPAVQALARDLPALAVATPSAADQHFREGERLFGTGDYPSAIAEYDMACAADAEQAGYCVALARAYQAVGDPASALVEARRALQIQPDLAAARVLAGQLYLAQGKPEAALQVLQAAVLADARDVEALRGLARVYAAQGQQAMALTQYSRLLALDPKDMDSLLAASSAAEQLGRWGDAADYDRRAIALQPQRADLRQGLIDLYQRQGDRAAAVAALKKAQDAGVRMSYDAAAFVTLARLLEAEAEEIIAAAGAEAEADAQGMADPRRADDLMAGLRQRADDLALAAEGLVPPPLLADGHRHRVLAFNQLNQSSYEFLRYFQTHQQERQSRAQLLRDAAERELARARGLDADAGWPVVTAEKPAPLAPPQGASSPVQ